MANKIICSNCGHKLMELRAQVGVEAMRAPDGTPLPSVPMYVIVEAKTINKKTGLAPGEAEEQDDIVAALAPMYKQYMDGVGALETGKKKRGRQ